MRPGVVQIRSVKDNDHIIAIFDMKQLKRYLSIHVATEFSNLVEPCYYPKCASIYKDLLHMTNADEKELIQYSMDKYGPNTDRMKIIHDPYNTLLILIIQEFLKNHDLQGGQVTFDLFSLRRYSNELHRFTTPKGGSRKPICIDDIFRSALESLSMNHMFRRQKSISAGIAYFSRDVFLKYKQAIIDDDSNKIFKMIYSLANRIKQSIKSLMIKYYEIYKNKSSDVTKDDESYDMAYETKLKAFIDKVTEDLCVYRRKNITAMQYSAMITKFNKKIALSYCDTISQPKYIESIRTAYYLLLKDLKDFDIIKQSKFLEYIKAKLSIKSTKQVMYFKKQMDIIQQQVLNDLNLNDWYNGLTIQSKSVSRNFIAYYLGLYLRYYV